VVVVDPLPVVRAGLEMLVEQHAGFELAGSADTAEAALSQIKSMKIHTGAVILVGLGLSGERDAFWLIRAVREQFPTSVVVACGANSDKKSISRALFTGADGFVDKGSPPEELFDVLRRCAAGEIVIGGEEADSIADMADAIDQQKDNQPTLTEREREVIQVAALGLTARGIGDHLGLSERTVTTHLGRIYRKLGVSTRVAAVSSATRAGLVTIERSESD
jgi:two-component system nitrate/nitrite response regulator NarL